VEEVHAEAGLAPQLERRRDVVCDEVAVVEQLMERAQRRVVRQAQPRPGVRVTRQHQQWCV
jgi:hypothetical protein